MKGAELGSLVGRRDVGGDGVALSILQRGVVEGLSVCLSVPSHPGGSGSSSTPWIATGKTGEERGLGWEASPFA